MSPNNKTKSHTKLNLVVLFTLFLSLITILDAGRTSANNNDPFAAQVYKTAWETINNKFYFRENFKLKSWEKKFDNKIKSVEDSHKYINKLISKLNDPYTRFLNKEEFDSEMKILSSSKLTGIGIKLSSQKPVVLDVLSESPAQNVDIRTDDYIVSVNGKSTFGLSTFQIAALIHGKPGNTVTVKLKRGHEVLEKSVIFKELNFKSVTSELLPDNILLIKVDSFIPENTSRLFKEELLKHGNLNGIIVDLRNNSGGLMKNAIDIADLFLSAGKIVSTVTKTSVSNDYANSSQLYKNGLVVLVNENTASASEILTSALKENNRAYVIGRKTFGKGLVQEIVKLPDGSALHVTCAVYLTPNGNFLNKKGIIPNEIVSDNDRQIKRAAEILLAQKDTNGLRVALH